MPWIKTFLRGDYVILWNPPADAGDAVAGLIPGWGRSPGEGKKYCKECFLFNLPEVYRINRIYKDKIWSDLFNHNHPGGCYQEIIEFAQ